MNSELRPGERCGDYELLAYIGHGGMAQVWSARSLLSRELVAVKTLLPAYAENPVLKERLSREGQSQNILQHPNILRSHGTYQWNGSIFMVMDLVDGESLEKYILRRRIMPVPEVRGIAQAVLSALSHAHANSIVHRDVKPSNILLSRKGRILLGDFGIALLQNSIRLTLFGGMGTPSYMSPEQIVGREIDHRSDIYSVACVLYELLTGAPPFHATGSDANEVVRRAHQYTVPEPLIPRNPEVPAALEKVVLRALEKPPANRFESCAEFAAALGVSIQVRPADDNRAGEPGANVPSHPAIVFPRGRAAVAGAGARNTPSIEIPRAGTPSGTPNDPGMSERPSGSRVLGPVSGPGITTMRYSPTPATEAPAKRSSLALITQRPGLTGIIAIAAATLLLVALAISKGRSGAPASLRPAATAATSTVPASPVREPPGGTEQSGVDPSPVVNRTNSAPQEEPPAPDSISGAGAQTAVDRIQSGTANGTTANTAGDAASNRPPPLSPPPVSGAHP